MRKSPLVSIVVPIYNVAAYLQRAINCSLCQTYTNIELLLINDGSTDQSGYICHKVRKQDYRVRVLEQPNQGASAARNLGIAHANGDYIFFLDADDTIESQTIELLLKAMLENNCDLTFCGVKAINIDQTQKIVAEQDYVLEKQGFYSNIELLKNMRSNNRLYAYNFDTAANKLYRTTYFKKYQIYFSTQHRYIEDALFLMDFLEKCPIIYYVNLPLYNYYLYDKSIRQSVTNSAALSERFSFYKESYLKLSNKTFHLLTPKEIQICKHNFADKTILACILLCHPDSPLTPSEKLCKLEEIVRDEIVADAIKHYSRTSGNSWTVPLLIQRQRPDLLLYFASKRAHKRYV